MRIKLYINASSVLDISLLICFQQEFKLYGEDTIHASMPPNVHNL